MVPMIRGVAEAHQLLAALLRGESLPKISSLMIEYSATVDNLTESRKHLAKSSLESMEKDRRQFLQTNPDVVRKVKKL
jgi:hypothetical protein